METKIYHCMNPKENPLPFWMKPAQAQAQPQKEPELDLVEQFKKNPDSFFPDFTVKPPKQFSK